MGKITEEMCGVTSFLSLGEMQAQDVASSRSVGEKNLSFFGISRAQKAPFHIDLGLRGELTCVDCLMSDKG